MSRQQKPGPAEMYEQYFVPGMFAPWASVLLEHAAPRRGERVLDLACGTGIVARSVAPLVGADGTVVGIDASPDMLAVARGAPEPAGAAIEWREGDAAALPDGPFDLVVCQQGLQFFPDRPAALREAHRVLASGGRAALCVWQALERQPVFSTLLEAEARHLGMPTDVVAGAPFSLGDAAELRALLGEAGFERLEVRAVTHEVRFPQPQRFVKRTTLAAAAVLPEMADMDEAARAELVDVVGREVDDTLRQYVDGDSIRFPLHAHIALAHA